jgi:uncharacterized membrane protein YkoI
MRLLGFSDFLAVPLLAGALLAAVPTADASDDEHDRDAVHRAVEAGQIKSLADILAAVGGKLPGEVAGVEIEREHGRWIYEFRVVDGKGRLYEVYVDASSGTIEKIKEK